MPPPKSKTSQNARLSVFAWKPYASDAATGLQERALREAGELGRPLRRHALTLGKRRRNRDHRRLDVLVQSLPHIALQALQDLGRKLLRRLRQAGGLERVDRVSAHPPLEFDVGVLRRAVVLQLRLCPRADDDVSVLADVDGRRRDVGVEVALDHLRFHAFEQRDGAVRRAEVDAEVDC